jgi:hypothetical protein
MAPGTGPIAFFTASFGKKPIYNFHRVTSEIWKQPVAGDRPTGSKRQRQRWLATAACGKDFSRCAIGVH